MQRLILGFEDRTSMTEFAEAVFGLGLSIYWMDSLDEESNDEHPTFIVRATGAKPESFAVWEG